MKLFYQRVSIFFLSLSSFFIFAVNSSYAASGSFTYIPRDTLNVTYTGVCNSSNFAFLKVGLTDGGSEILTNYLINPVNDTTTAVDLTAQSNHGTLGVTYYAHLYCPTGPDVTGSFVYSLPVTPTPANSYVLGSTTQTSISDMTVGSTQSFFSVFSANWVTLIVFAIGIIAFFFFYRLVMKSIRSRGINM